MCGEMDWETYQDEFVADGSLRKIIIKNVTQANWKKLLNFLVKTEVSLQFFIDGVRAVLPSQIEDVLQKDDHQHLLALIFNDVTLNCSFDRDEDIVLSFEPGQITNERKAKLIFRIMSTFGRRLNKVALLTEESREEPAIFQYQPGQGLTYIKLNQKFKSYE